MLDDVMAEFLPESEWADYDPVEVMYRMADRIVELTERLTAVEAERDALIERLTAVNVCYGNESSGRVLAERERDRAERILAALREPSEAVIHAGYAAWADACLKYQTLNEGVADMIRAAVTAAEKEASGA